VRRVLWLLLACASLSACLTTRPPPSPAVAVAPWEQREAALQRAAAWQLDGRVAVTVGRQGWQASLDWNQAGESSEAHVAGPLGIGALVLTKSPAGLTLNGAPPGDAVLQQLQERLGFDLPVDELRFWLLGVPNPGEPSELTRNPQDRAQHLTQAGWSVDYDRYVGVDGDSLPVRVVMSRDDVRVKIAVDHWRGVK
jgi:outer membrane lipoprotein LolB